MNSHQRKKARKQGKLFKECKQRVDNLFSVLYKLDLSERHNVYGNDNWFRFDAQYAGSWSRAGSTVYIASAEL